MVLVLALERQDPQQKKDTGKAPPQYRFFQHSTTVAVVYDAKEDKPTGEQVEAALAVAAAAPPHETQSSPPFFVTPFDLLLDHSAGESPKAPLEKLLVAVNKSVGRRENTTIIDRGVRSGEHLERLMLSVLDTVKSSAEYAMQLVAEEVAKEKQMQRLLQLENETGLEDDNRDRGQAGDGSSAAAGQAVSRKERSLPVSKKLKDQLKQLQKDHPYANGGAGGAAAGRAAPAPTSSPLSSGKRGTRGAADQHLSHNPQYTLLSAASWEDLVPPCAAGTTLVPASFTIHPPMHRAGRGTAMSVVRERNTRSHSFQFAQQRRKSTLALLSQLKNHSVDKEDVAPLKGNGWGQEVSFYHFDGEQSIMAVPGVPHFEELVKGFSVDFWLRTDCRASEGKRILLQIADGQREDVGQLFQLGLNWYEEMEESLRVFFRDSTNRVLEALIPVKAMGVCAGGKEFHHVMLHIRSLDEGTLECVIDGTPVAIQFLQQEHPIAFNPWPHRLFIGGCLNEDNNPAMVLRGCIAELRFWTGDGSPKLVVRWPLLADGSGKLAELTHTIPAEHHETLLHLREVEEPAPHSAPLFDRDLVMNAGTLPLWGELMHNWRLEIRFRTDVSSRMMTLVGVTDQKFKMQEIGIVLNAEPVFSKDHFRFREFNTTFYLVDVFGACCSALLRGTERQSLMDGEWHTLVWKCVDSEANKFTVKVDGVRQELLYVAREGPSRFAEMDNWVCVGGHNVRNWKVKRVFEGFISRFFVTLRGHPYATIQMNEGPGAHVLLDRSGHCNHGLLIHPETNAVRRNDVTWIPAQDKSDAEEENEGEHVDVVMYRNNNVAVAAVIFTCVFDEVGTPHEVIYDIHQNAYFHPEATPHAVPEAKPMWGTWQSLPSACFKPLETLNQLEESINTVLQSVVTPSSTAVPRGHLMTIIRVGDCHVTLLHLQEPDMPPEAVYNTHMLKWRYPFTIEGVHGRRELMLNRMVESLEGVLLNATLKPFVTARVGPLNRLQDGSSIVCEDVVRALQSCGMPWYLAAVTHSLLLHTEYGSCLHVIHHLFPSMSFDQAAALCLFNSRLVEGARDKAAIVIQRNWKVVEAKAEAARREAIRQSRDRKVEDIRVFRMNPTVQAKHNLYALLITLHDTACDKIPSIRDEAATAELEDLLKKQGYVVERLTNPSAAALMKAVAHVDADKSSFVYISGYGGQMNIRQPPLLSLQALHLSLQESNARAGIEAGAGAEFRALKERSRADALEVNARKKKKKAAGKKAAPAAKKVSAEEQEMQARQLEAIFRAAQMDVEQEEAFARDGWVQDHDAETQAILREMRQTIVSTREFEKKFKGVGAAAAVGVGPAGGHGRNRRSSNADEAIGSAPQQRNFIFPCECKSVEPYASLVLDVEELVRTALHRQVSPIGLQSIVAVDLEPVTAFAKGFACLASSTGNTLRVPYQPQQRRLLTAALNKAFVGDFPVVPAVSKYAVITGGIETSAEQRDWKSFATFVAGELRPAFVPAPSHGSHRSGGGAGDVVADGMRALHQELNREMPFTAELVPIRGVALNAEAQDRRQRDREAQKVNAVVSFGVGSTKVQSDMFSVFKGILEGLPLSEIAFSGTINILLTECNKGIDGVMLSHATAEIEKCRPLDCTVSFTCTYGGDGIIVTFNSADASQKLALTQWISSIVARSLSWQITRNPIEGYRRLEVDYVEYVYKVKTLCHLRRFDALVQQWYAEPVPEPYIRFLEVGMVKGK